LIFSLSSQTILTTLSVAVLLDFLIFINGLQISFAEQRSPQSPELLVANSVPNPSNTADAAVTGIVHSNKTIKQTVTLNIDKVSDHYPTLQEKGRIDKIVNQALGILKPITSAINKSHICILEAVICGSSNIPNVTMLKI
jgi:hypothetical protein